MEERIWTLHLWWKLSYSRALWSHSFTLFETHMFVGSMCYKRRLSWSSSMRYHTTYFIHLWNLSSSTYFMILKFKLLQLFNTIKFDEQWEDINILWYFVYMWCRYFILLPCNLEFSNVLMVLIKVRESVSANN